MTHLAAWMCCCVGLLTCFAIIAVIVVMSGRVEIESQLRLPICTCMKCLILGVSSFGGIVGS